MAAPHRLARPGLPGAHLAERSKVGRPGHVGLPSYDCQMRPVHIEVDGEPPMRATAIVSANRDSPHAKPLFSAAMEVVASDPDSYPITEYVRVEVTSARVLAEGDGYAGIDAIEEVLVDAGILRDERLVRSENQRVDPNTAGFAVDITPEPV